MSRPHRGAGWTWPPPPAALWRDAGVQTVLAEPGATLATALVEAGVVDRVVRHVARSVQATDGRPRIVAPVAASARWPLVRRVERGPDLEVVVDRPPTAAGSTDRI